MFEKIREKLFFLKIMLKIAFLHGQELIYKEDEENKEKKDNKT